MHKLPRFNSFKQPSKAIPEKTESEEEYTLSLPKSAYDANLKSKSEMLSKKYEEPDEDDVLNSDLLHRMYMLHVIMEAFSISAKSYISYLRRTQE